jgi:hypothetical protein
MLQEIQKYALTMKQVGRTRADGSLLADTL